MDKIKPNPNRERSNSRSLEADFLSLVRRVYVEKGVRPLSKALSEASRLWSEKEKKPEI